MTKFKGNESLNMFRDHVDPEKEEHLKWIIREVDTKVKRIVKLVKGINSGNRDANQKKRSEAIHLIEDFHKQYQVLCALYEDLKEGVKRKCNNEEDSESSPSSSYSLSMESAAYYSPGSGSKTPSLDQSKVATTDGQSMKSENSCYSLEDTSEVVKEALSVEPVSSSYKAEERQEEERGRTVEKLMKETGYLRDRLGEREKRYEIFENKSSVKMKELEDRVLSLKLEIEAFNYENGEHEEESKSRHDGLHKRSKENLGFQSWVSKLELAFKEKEGGVLSKLDECEKILKDKIDETMDQVQNMQTEVDLLRSQNDEARKDFSYKKEKEHESLRIQSKESQMKLDQKTKEMADECEKILRGKIEESMDQVQHLQMEVDSLRSHNDEASKNSSYETEKKLESLRAQNEESQMEFKKKMKEAVDDCEKVFRGKIQESMERVQDLRMEVDSLRSQNGEELKSLRIQNKESEMEFNKKSKQVADECEKNFHVKIEESMDRVRNLRMEVDCLRSQNDKARKNIIYEKEKELESLRIQNNELEMELKKKTKEAADFLEVLESLTEKLKQKTSNEESLVEETNSLKKQVKNLELRIVSINDEGQLLKYENKKQKTTISQLEGKLKEKEDQISTLESKIEGVKKDLLNKINSLEQNYKSLEMDKKEIEGKNDVLAATIEQKDVMVTKLNNQAKASFRTTVKKMEEMVEEFRKKSEDSIRILSQRIRVTEQLHNETKDWYKKTKDKFEQDQRDNELALRTIKLVMTKVSDTLNVSETHGLRFTECCEAFTNRVSKVSCEINFAKGWVKRKNSAMVQVKEDLDELLVQLDDKEEEILGSRQKVLKLENRLRELEKTLKENSETMIALKEEKREAIRQLCVWTDYHRSRSDYLQKAFTELVARNHRPS